MAFDGWKNEEVKVRRETDEHYRPSEINELEQMTIDAWNQHHRSYGYLQQQETLKMLKEQEKKQKKAEER